MIDSLTETVLPLGAAARRQPSLRGGRPVSPATIWRWSTSGCLARDGQRIKLETIRIGGQSCTSLEALQRFFARLSGDESVAAPQPSTAHAAKAQARSEAVLNAAGI